MSKNDVDLSDPSGDCVGATARLFKASGEDGIWVGPHSNLTAMFSSWMIPKKLRLKTLKKQQKCPPKKSWSSHIVGVAENSYSISWVCSFLNTSMISSTWLSYSQRLLTRNTFPSCCSRRWSRILSIVWNGSNWKNIIVRLTLKKWSCPMLCHVCFEHLMHLIPL